MNAEEATVLQNTKKITIENGKSAAAILQVLKAKARDQGAFLPCILEPLRMSKMTRRTEDS